MRNLLKVIIIAALLTVSLSSFAFADDPNDANDAILVYNYNQNYWYANGSSSSWSTGNSSMSGYMIFDVIYDANGAVSDINDVTQFNLYRSGSSKYYYETTPNLDIIRVPETGTSTSSRHGTWTFVQSSSSSSLADLTIVQGDFQSSLNIGNSDPNECASRLDGSREYYNPGENTSIKSYDISWRLNRGWTRRYNYQNMNMSQVRSDIRSYLRRRGYGGDM